MRLPRLPALCIAPVLALVSSGCDAQDTSDPSEHAGARVVGTPSSIRAAAIPRDTPSWLPHQFAFTTDQGEEVPVVARSYDYDGDYVAVNGTAEESERSAFLLKGDGQEIYGWLVLPDRELAYEYTTSPRGDVLVQRVPVTSILPVCNDGPAQPGPPLAFEPPLAEPAGDPPHVGTYDGSANTNKLQSRPGASKVLYMDFSSLTLPPAELYLAWQGVASAYSAFEVNVTTDVAVYEATTARNRGKACIKNEDGRSTCYVNSFGTTRCCDIYNKGNGNYQGLTLAHEFGHMMGLDHDGIQSTEYFTGFSAYKWVPLMGDSTPERSWGSQALYQWSKGEYSGANNKEDDLAILTKNLPFRADDVPSTRELIVSGSQVASAQNRGQIAGTGDSDAFTFTVGSGGGHAKLLVERIEVLGGGMLDVDAEIRSAAGESVAKNNDKAARTASLDVDLAEGQYQLIVKGGAEGTPESGFSSYASLGYYGISGTITGAMSAGGGSGGTPGAGGVAGTGGGAGRSGAGGSTGSGGRSVRPPDADAGARDSGRDAGRDRVSSDNAGGTGSGGVNVGSSGTVGSGGTSASGGNGGDGAGGARAAGGAASAGGGAGTSAAQASGGSAGSPGAGGAGGSPSSATQGGSGAANSTTSRTGTSSSTGCSCNVEGSGARSASGLLGCLALAFVLLRLGRAPGKPPAGRGRSSARASLKSGAG